MANIANANGAYVSGGSGNVYNLNNQTTFGYYLDGYNKHSPFKFNYSGGNATANFYANTTYNDSFQIYTPFMSFSNLKITINGIDYTNIVLYTTDGDFPYGHQPAGFQLIFPYVFQGGNVQISFNYQSLIY